MSQRYALEARFGEERHEFVEWVPHCAVLGIRVVRVGPASATLRLPFREDLVGDPDRGVVFGGVITTLLDQAGGVATICGLETIVPVATIDLRVDYLRAARPGMELFGTAELFKQTRSVAFVRGKAWDADEEDPFAHFIATYMLGSRDMEHPLKRFAAEQAGG